MPKPILATYRVQLHAAFNFDDAAALTDYLQALGVSHLYSSPCLQAAPGSTHGYDVVDPQRVSDDLGGSAGHARLVAALREHRLGMVLDVVPNHMAISAPQNAWWWDVLENGPASRYARHFDVDWDPPETKLRNMVLVPILADHYGRVLDAGQLSLARSDARIVVRYADHVLPVAPRSLDTLLAVAATRCGSEALAAIADTFGLCPWRRHRSRQHGAASSRQGVAACRARRLIAGQPAVAAAIDAEIAEINADVEQLRRCSSARTIAWPSGARRRASSATGASSTSTRWSACAWRTKPSLPTRTRWYCAGSPTAHSTACASTIRTVCAIRKRTCSACTTPRRRRGSWSRRSCNRASACARRGRSTAPPATISCNASARCSSTRPGQRR
jgi:maltooligosyltrehalose synthase